MLINSATITTLGHGFKASFQAGFAGVQPQWQQVAMEVPSTTSIEEYGWLKDLPRIREWIGDRVIHAMASNGYQIKNKPWEFTLGVKRTDIEDDNIGIYAPLFQMLGAQSATFPDELVWPLLKSGFNTPCFDGKNYFATDHPVLDETGAPQAVSNHGGGAGTPWYLLHTMRPMKPIIFQNRKPFEFISMTLPSDEAVFSRQEYRYGLDGRSNVGYGFWQCAYGSKQALDAAGYQAARTAMMNLKGDYGRPLGIVPDLLVVPPSLEGAARKLLVNDRNDAGATNEWAGTARVLVVPWLA